MKRSAKRRKEKGSTREKIKTNLLLGVLILGSILVLLLATHPEPLRHESVSPPFEEVSSTSSGFCYQSEKKEGQSIQPEIALVVDDLGYDLELARAFIAMDEPLGIAVLPLAPYTSQIIAEAHERGKEVLLHLPMEPKSFPEVSPGPGALYLSMAPGDIRRIVADHLDRMAVVRGVNNHMGSAFCENRDGMTAVLEEVKSRGLFYLDSVTTRRTVSLELAREMGVPSASRSVFIDNILTTKAMNVQGDRLVGIAGHLGFAVCIAHPHRETLDFLRTYLPEAKRQVRVVPVSVLAK